jgi:CBS domain-containing protein
MNATRIARSELVLRAQRACDLMTPNPISIRDDATIREALTMLLDHKVGAAPVIDIAGRPIGVVSVTDILIHERQVATLPIGLGAELSAAITGSGKLRDSLQIECEDPTLVSQVMTPGIFAVSGDYPAEGVVREMLQLGVHRLFVSDLEGAIVGVISTTDILRHLAS